MEIAAIIALASSALTLFNKGMDYLAVKKTQREMTPEEEKAYDALCAERMKAPHWQKSKP